MNNSAILIKFLTIQAQLKIMHWQTKSRSRHEAFGDTYDALDDMIDLFVETYQGKNGRFLLGEPLAINVSDISAIKLSQWLESLKTFFTTELPSFLDQQKDTDLLNIKDEMLGAINKLKYLLTLN